MQDIYRRIGNEVIKCAKKLKYIDDKRLMFNAKIKSQKYAQKKSLVAQIVECMEMSAQVDYEAIKAFEDYLRKLDEARYQILVEEGYIEAEM